jgi:hypothetical protein
MNKIIDNLYNDLMSGLITETEYYKRLRSEGARIRAEKEKKEQDIRDNFNKNNTQDECPICFESVTKSDQIECGHYVHLKCLESAQKVTNKLFYECPYCKYHLLEVEPPLQTDDGKWIYDFPLDKITYRFKTSNRELEPVIKLPSGDYWLLSKHLDKSKNHKLLHDICMNNPRESIENCVYEPI